jgi:hypothetical protein
MSRMESNEQDEKQWAEWKVMNRMKNNEQNEK